MREYKGLPDEYNPFLVVADESCDNTTLGDTFPEYFKFDDAADLPMARVRPNVDFLNQHEAEGLVRDMVAKNPKLNFAVKEECAHIIPADLRKTVRVVKVKVDIWYDGTSCRTEDCFYLN